MELDLLESSVSPARSGQDAGARGSPLVEAEGLGVSFSPESKRDDVQSLTYRWLLGAKRRPPFWALREVTFAASAGEILGIIGANGSGKTTLCRVLAGLIRPDRGVVAVRGETSALLSLGTGFNARLSGRENILLNGLMLGLSARQIKSLLAEIVEFSGLGRFIDEPLNHYSAGMRSRLGFSIASMLEPEILVLDETLSTGDLEFSARAGERLQALIRKSTLVIIVSHQLDFVAKYCTRALWLDRGTVRAQGRPDEVVPQYVDSIPNRRRPSGGVVVEGAKAESRPTEALVASHVGVRYRYVNQTRPGASIKGRQREGHASRSFWALDDVSFTLSDGEILGIIGPNGAGKTTLCKVLTGIIKPDRGAARIEGELTALLTLGAGFNNQLTGRDNVYLNAMFLGMRRRLVQDAYPEIVSFAELASFMDEPVKHYSKGMRSRLAFSTAATIEPDTLIVDEVLNAGDAAFFEKATEKIHELIQRARAVIVVTHNLAFVQAVCTRALWLRAGRIAFDGAPAEAIRRYRESLRVAPKAHVMRKATADA